MPPPLEPQDPEEPLDTRAVVDALRKDKLRAALFGDVIEERRIGRYRVIGTLGRGGMGTVLEAVDDALQRHVALKLLHHDGSPHDQERLLREARALARLSHPNVVQVHEVVEHPRLFIAMEKIKGQTLARWQRARPPWRACVRAYVQAGRGLAAAHAEQLVHRDFKPSNCIIDDEGRVRVMDFGLARSLGSRRARAEPPTEVGHSERGDFDPTLTETGALMGTLAYMPLEQLEGKEVDASSDQFGFCVALYEALYGMRPFAGHSVDALRNALRHEEVAPPPRGARVPKALRRVVLRGLAAQSDRRWPAMNDLLEALEGLVAPRWRGRLAASMFGGGLVLAGASVWHEATLGQVCAQVEAQLEGIWGGERRREVREVLLGAELPYAQDAWEGVESRLDAYADAWVDASVDLCEASKVRKDQSESVVARRAGCLHERKVALNEAVAVLASAEPRMVERAVSVVVGLPSLERCHDLPALLAELAPPEDPQIQARVRSLRDELAKARALRLAGRYPSSLEVVRRGAQAAEGLDYPPLRAEVELSRGWALYGDGRHEQAAAAFEDAYARAASEGHDAVATDAATMLSYVVGALQSKYELGLKWGITARAHASRPAADPGAQAMALSNLGAVHAQRGELELARSSHEQALELQEKIFGPDDLRLAYTFNGLGVVLVSLGEIDAAVSNHLRALALRRDHLGRHHPYVAMSLNNLGVASVHQARFEDAQAYFHQALEIKEAILGPEHPDLASSLNNLGGLSFLRGENEAAIVLFRRALAINERVYGSRAVQLVSMLDNLGLLLVQQGRVEEAQTVAGRAISIVEEVHDGEHPTMITSLLVMSQISRSREDLEEALGHTDRAISIATRMLGPKNLQLAGLWLEQSRIHLARGQGSLALDLAERALTLRRDEDEPVVALAQARLLKSKALASVGGVEEEEEAAAIAEHVVEALALRSDPETRGLREEAQQWLEELRRRDLPR